MNLEQMKKEQAVDLKKAGIIDPEMDSKYVCLTCATKGKSDPRNGLCFVCGADNWHETNDLDFLKEVVLNEKQKSIQNYVYFCMNYPYDFIEKCWEGDKHLIEHLKPKFKSYYSKFGPSAVMNEFFVNLSSGHQLKLAKWIDENTNFCNRVQVV